MFGVLFSLEHRLMWLDCQLGLVQSLFDNLNEQSLLKLIWLVKHCWFYYISYNFPFNYIPWSHRIPLTLLHFNHSISVLWTRSSLNSPSWCVSLIAKVGFPPSSLICPFPSSSIYKKFCNYGFYRSNNWAFFVFCHISALFWIWELSGN